MCSVYTPSKNSRKKKTKGTIATMQGNKLQIAKMQVNLKNRNEGEGITGRAPRANSCFVSVLQLTARCIGKNE